ncbi:MAG: FlgD immunoglobulin-like domain containing protein [Candidatus Krumholzibacteriia bacterium]
MRRFLRALPWSCWFVSLILLPAFARQTTVLFTMDAGTGAHHHPAYPIDPDLVVELGTDCEFAWAYVRAEAPDGVGTYFTSSTSLTPTPRDWSAGPRQGLVLAYVPFEQFIPAHATIVAATLGVIAKNNWYIGSLDSLMATSLTGSGDLRWWESMGVGQNPHQAHASWKSCIQGCQDSSDPASLRSLGYPEVSRGTWPWTSSAFHMWDLGRSQMSRFRGDECDGYGYADPDCGWASFQNGHDVQLKMRRLVQAMVNGEPNLGFCLMTICETTTSLQSFYHWDTNALGGDLGGEPRDYKPFWVVTYSDQDYEPYLPGGAEGALVFTTDDGIGNANRQFAQAYADAGLPPLFGLYLAEIHVGARGHGLTFADLAALRAQGVEIGSHSRWHAVDPNGHRDGLTVYDPNDYGQVVEYYPGMPSDELTLNATGWDSLLVDTDPIWLYEGLEKATGRSYLDDPYVAKGFALPHQDFDLPAVRALHQQGYRYFRCGIAGTVFTNPGQWAYLRRFTLPWSEGLYVPADTFRVYCPTNGEPFNAMGLPLTLQLDELDQDATYTEAEIKLWARHRMEVLMAQELAGGVLSFYSHDVPDGTGWYTSGCLRPEWLTWILEEYIGMGSVWICRPRDLNDWIRSTRTAIATPDEWLVHDAWRWTAADGEYLCGGGVPRVVGVSIDEGSPSGSQTPSAVTLGPGSPNPFNPTTHLTIELTSAGPVSLCVHDLAGRRIRTLVNGQLGVGRHDAAWDGRNDAGELVPSGVYLLRVTSARGSDTAKVALVR